MKYFFIYTFLTLNFLNVYCQSIEELSAEIYRDSSFIFNDSVKKIFKGDVIYLIDFDEKNKIYNGYINGRKESIKSNNLIIADGDITPTFLDWTDLASTNIGSPITRVYTIENTGSGAITISSIEISGTDAALFKKNFSLKLFNNSF